MAEIFPEVNSTSNLSQSSRGDKNEDPLNIIGRRVKVAYEDYEEPFEGTIKKYSDNLYEVHYSFDDKTDDIPLDRIHKYLQP